MDKVEIRTDVNKDASKYAFGWGVPDSQRFRAVQAYNQATFLMATGFESGNTITYVYALPEVEFSDPLGLIKLKVQPLVGTARERGMMATNVNTLIVEADCSRVRTSHPGLPGGMLPNDPRITGTPVYVPRETAFPVRPPFR